MSNIEWLWTSGTEFDSHTASVPEKLAKHGYAVALNRMETGKMQTAQLCVHDVLAGKENPNIAIICPKHLAPSWHFSMLWDLGLEFKYFGVFEKSLDLFSDVVANFCIISEEALLSGSEIVLSQAGGSGVIWDLMIVDLASAETSELNEKLKNTKAKAKKLLINSPADAKDVKCDKLSALVKTVLQRNKKDKGADCAINTEPDGQAAAGRNMAGNYNIKTINYKIDGALIAKTERIDDVRLGVPLYSYGGNIFEEYSLKERKTYLSDEYDKAQLKKLLAVDGKLEAFLKEIVTLLADSENRIVVYCTSQNTVNYVSKALWACNGGKKGICVYDRATTDGDFVKNELYKAGTEEPNIIVADDKAGSRFLNVEKITHIINYEYPESPATLEQRLTRVGRKPNANTEAPAFYIFCDDDYKFDGRMLRKTVLSNTGRAFSRVPDKNLLFDIDGIEEHFIVLILDLKFIADNAKDDIVESFRVEYNAPEVDTAADAADTAQKRLQSLVEMFGLQEIMKQDEVDGEQLFMQISEQIEKFKGNSVCLDEKGVLTVAKANPAPAKAPNSEQIKAAAEFAKKLTGKKEDFALLKAETEKLSYCQKLSVLTGAWKHYRFDLKVPKSYKDFIELYNYVETH
ncbi:MAG: hypothetical protein FWD48_11725 [Oscillospiraceae bacterium]|nr:hypothetical protein [Oscillospiraceae bacterium]